MITKAFIRECSLFNIATRDGSPRESSRKKKSKFNCLKCSRSVQEAAIPEDMFFIILFNIYLNDV